MAHSAVNGDDASESGDELRRIMRDSLWRELLLRRDRAPHAQLGVVVGADAATIQRAFQRLRIQFHPGAHASLGAEVVALARELSGLVQAAFLQLAEGNQLAQAPQQPPNRDDETVRALEKLRQTIVRRKSQALRLVAAGDRAGARRLFESVLRLDPHDAVAGSQLQRMRAADRGVWRIFAAVWIWLWAALWPSHR